MSMYENLESVMQGVASDLNHEYRKSSNFRVRALTGNDNNGRRRDKVIVYQTPGSNPLARFFTERTRFLEVYELQEEIVYLFTNPRINGRQIGQFVVDELGHYARVKGKPLRKLKAKHEKA